MEGEEPRLQMSLRVAESAWALRSARRGNPPGDFKPIDELDSGEVDSVECMETWDSDPFDRG